MINLPKPKTCCAIGSYDHTVPTVVAGRVHGVDLCISDIVAALNAANIETIGSCCGHGTQRGYVQLADGRMLLVDIQSDGNAEVE